MNILLKRFPIRRSNLTLHCLRRLGSITKILHDEEILTQEERLFKKHQEHILHSDYLEQNGLTQHYKKKVITIDKYKAKKEKIDAHKEAPLPLSLKYLGYSTPNKKSNVECKEPVEAEVPIQFPYQDTNASIGILTNVTIDNETPTAKDTDLEIRTRLELLNKSDEHQEWMHNYENFPLSVSAQEEGKEDHNNVTTENVNYGTPNPMIPTSKVPCGGCGALLHCKDPAIPGYLPSEIYMNYKARGGVKLEGVQCQRCHFLEHYNMALQVRVSPEDYPKVLQTIAQKKQALVVLLVDLLDFPCSIWPGISDLIGINRPIVVVGNKVDLLPDDGKGYLKRVHDNLANSLREGGFAMTNIKHIALVSAKTGFGIEDLITRLHSIWNYRGDVYIVGCTNVGKSTLFNTLLQSDYCKQSAADLIQRATTSPWPGTTLNLLKFPIMRPSGWRLFVRHKRLGALRHLESQERELRRKMYRKTGNTKYAALIGHIERSFSTEEPVDDENSDIYAVRGRATSRGQKPVGLNMKDHRWALSKWCYDTPGVVQPQQIIHHFTTEELMKIFPATVIKPRTFSMQPGSSLFIAGIARLDYLEGEDSCRFTVFCSHELPITICRTSQVEVIYNDLLTTNAFEVPVSNEERLKLWPKLEGSKYFKVTGIDNNTSCEDLVLSNAGWVAITPDTGETCTIQGWTPGRCGIYLRDSLLPNMVRFRGKKLRQSCAYRN